jgi:hypothetical protein
VPVRVAGRGGGDALWGELEVSDGSGDRWAVAEGPRELAGTRPPAWELTLVPLETGDLELPSLQVALREGETSRQLSASSLPTVTVASVLPEEGDPEAAPIRDPLGVGGFPWEWVLPLAVPAMVMAVGLAMWSRRRRQPGALLPGRPLPPLEELEKLLDRLETRVGHDPADGVYDRLAFALRHFVQRQCDHPAEDMTSFELRQLIRELGWPDEVQRGVPQVMATADRVRFGRAATDEGELRRALGTTRETARAIDGFVAEQQRLEAEEIAG